jgi:hypothetical protein
MTEKEFIQNKIYIYMFRFLGYLFFLLTFAGCTKQQAIVQIVQILDEIDNQPIEAVDISISSAEIPGRGKDDLYAWDLKYPINIPIVIAKSPIGEPLHIYSY